MITPEAYDWLNAYAKHVLADTMGAGENRSAALKACFDLTRTALTVDRMNALRELRRQRNVPIEVVLSDVLDAGLAALRSRP